MRLLDPNVQHDDAELANMIFTAGFTTVDKVTELAGRGVGMDVVRSEVVAMGGRIETATTAAGQGTSFKLILPLTTAVTQVVMLRCGDSTIAVPSTLVEIVRRATPIEVTNAYASGGLRLRRAQPAVLLARGLAADERAAGRDDLPHPRRRRRAQARRQRVAVHVDEVLGNHESGRQEPRAATVLACRAWPA